MFRSHAFLRILRNIHLYLGVFIAPALLFFAFTGALQTFGLHETTQGSNYKPPAWAATLAQLHKKQTTEVPARRPRPSDQASRQPPTAHGHSQPGPEPGKPSDAPPARRHLPMKIFFLIVSVGLLLSTLTGIYMTFTYSRNKVIISGLLAAGIFVPLLLLPF